MPSDPANLLLGRLALHYKLVTQEQLVRAGRLQAQEGGTRRLGEILVAEGSLSQRDLERLLVVQREVAAKQAAATPAAPAPLAARGGLDDILVQAVERGASDVHLHAGAPIQLRIHGRLEPLPGAAPVPAAEAESLIAAVLTPEQREQLAKHGQVDLAHTLPGAARFRGNVYRQQRGLDAVFRAIPAAPPTLESLGLPRALARFANYHQGMVLFTGPAGCGKSATMAAMVNIVNEERRDHIITIEDPIEVLHPSHRCLVNQRQVGRHTGSFARALRAALREDPDVLVIGELRDLETISLALTAAETGHLVFATLHTSSAVRTVTRLVGVFPPQQQAQIRTMVSESLRAVVSQRLLQRAGGGGRVPALEVLVNTKAVANLIRESKTFQIRSVLQIGGAQGMGLLDASLAELVRTGVVTREEALLHAEEPGRFMVAAAPAGAAPAGAAA